MTYQQIYGGYGVNYQKIVDGLRWFEDGFIGVGGTWPGHHGAAESRYPNLAAELVARECQIGTPVNAAGISREAFAAVIEDGAELGKVQLWKIAIRLGVNVDYLKMPMLAYVDPTTEKGKRRRAILKRLLKSSPFQGVHTFNAMTTLDTMMRGSSVTYAAWRYACESTQWEALLP